MKPWPSELAAKYPVPPGRVPERPWWWAAGERVRGEAARCWGGSGSVPYFYQDTVRADGLYVCCETKGMAALREAADADQPLPHPGFRVGQVWGSVNGDTRTLAAFATHNSPLCIEEYYSRADKTHFLTYHCLDFDCFCYLVADPCCPWLAPWSPPL